MNPYYSAPPRFPPPGAYQAPRPVYNQPYPQPQQYPRPQQFIQPSVRPMMVPQPQSYPQPYPVNPVATIPQQTSYSGKEMKKEQNNLTSVSFNPCYLRQERENQNQIPSFDAESIDSIVKETESMKDELQRIIQSNPCLNK